MMAGVIITKLIAERNDKITSEVIFNDSLTVIYGPSDTGKTWVLESIDYALGSKYWPLPDNYEKISLYLKKDNFEYTIIREKEQKFLDIVSTDDDIESGKYLSVRDRGKESSLDDVLMKIFEINSGVKIIKNTKNQRQTLTWRSIRNLFVNIGKINDKQSIIYDGELPLFNLTSLNYLYDKNVFSGYQEKNDSIKTMAIREFIENKIKQKESELILLENEISENDTQNIDVDIDRFNELSNSIMKVVEENEKIHTVLTGLYRERSELLVKNDRYVALRRLYCKKMDRTNFLMDGFVHQNEVLETNCPICNSKVKINNMSNSDFYSSLLSEHESLRLKIESFDKFIKDFTKSIADLERNISETNEQYEIFSKKICEMRKEYDNYRIAIDENENVVKTKLRIDELNNQIEELKRERDSTPTTKYKSFDKSKEISNLLKADITDELKTSIKYCFGTDDVVLDKDWNLVIDGKSKSTYGDGYIGIFNTLTVLSISLVLMKKGLYCPGFIIIDSPITKLSEPEGIMEKSNKLFDYFVKMTKGLQIIIAENNDRMDKTNFVNYLVEFTKDMSVGRYGFLKDLSS